jgi:anti-sigma B factor antagonist
MPIETQTTIINGVVILRPSGNLLEAADGENILHEVDNHISDINKFILDCSQIKHLNSTGISLILKIFTQVRNQGGELLICSVSKPIEKLLIITKLNSIFTIFATVEDALENLKLQDA